MYVNVACVGVVPEPAYDLYRWIVVDQETRGLISQQRNVINNAALVDISDGSPSEAEKYPFSMLVKETASASCPARPPSLTLSTTFFNCLSPRQSCLLLFCV